MVTKFFSLAGIAALGGFVWMGCAGKADGSGPSGAPGSDAGTNPNGTKSPDGGGGNGTGDGDGDGDGGSTQPAGVKVTYGTCPAFAKCDSDPVGSWTVSGGCLSDEGFKAAKTQCPGLKESDVAITANGTAEITATNIKRKSTIHFSAKANVPRSCAFNLGCNLIAMGLRGEIAADQLNGLKFDEATCVSGTNNTCDCDVASTITEETDATYTKAGGTMTTASSPARKYDYCVTGNKLGYTETTDPSSPFKFVVEMTK